MHNVMIRNAARYDDMCLVEKFMFNGPINEVLQNNMPYVLTGSSDDTDVESSEDTGVESSDDTDVESSLSLIIWSTFLSSILICLQKIVGIAYIGLFRLRR